MEFTKTQKRILEVLADGGRHLKAELKNSLPDKEASPKTVAVHICYLRKKLRPIGQDIVCEYYRRRIHYRQVRLLKVE